ncbi:uncharacterized protein B0H18DRAFT_957799 [Fomitopsis serialis]|uniref:uncharacterized protein n=1 Tax=Fomitopsis serialis TaxID=139415 RepID=UPI0020082903|nr:uncharacterized protein B0H18DRAFT_957799 [Neoantrodia serialis]KAH9918804.1 hypothetical protein B0H18DRAFT_957799 [Neoantrodia serialis]
MPHDGDSPESGDEDALGEDNDMDKEGSIEGGPPAVWVPPMALPAPIKKTLFQKDTELENVIHAGVGSHKHQSMQVQDSNNIQPRQFQNMQLPIQCGASNKVEMPQVAVLYTLPQINSPPPLSNQDIEDETEMKKGRLAKCPHTSNASRSSSTPASPDHKKIQLAKPVLLFPTEVALVHVTNVAMHLINESVLIYLPIVEPLQSLRHKGIILMTGGDVTLSMELNVAAWSPIWKVVNMACDLTNGTGLH